MKKNPALASVVIAILCTVSAPSAVAKDCQGLSDAVSAAEASVAGLMASVSRANSAVSMARSKLNSARLPAQRVSAQVALLREEKSASQARSALNGAKNVLRSARLALTQCK
jgi:hypothetical protein